MDKMLSRQIGLEHFDYVSDGDKNSYTNALFKLVQEYWSESGGSLFTSLVLESKMNAYRLSERQRGKLLTLWQEISDSDIDDNDFHEISSQLKNRRCLKLLSKMFTEGHEKLSSEGLSSTVQVIQENLDQIQVQMNEIGGDRHNFDITQSSDFFKIEYDKRINHPELFKGINCGVSNIDEKTFGWLPGQIIVFLAPSSGGKSVMLLNAAMHANKKCNKKVLYMSFEMNSWLCLLRHISLSFEIPYSVLKDNNLAPDELKDIINGLDASKDGAYFEYDVNMEDPTPEYIDSRIRDLIATKGKPDLLVVDYIGNMTVRNPGSASKDWELQSKAIQQLFIMAKRYNIPILTAQQINREAIRDSRKSKEANKFMSYDQAAASGGQNLMHLCTYAIAMEPNREKGYCVLHPVKMRDAWFKPFPIAMDSDYNKVRELTPEEQDQIMAMHAMNSGATVVPTKTKIEDKNEFGKTPLAGSNKTEDDEFFEPIKFDAEEELHVEDWAIG
jgi:replicative DNA helicase